MRSKQNKNLPTVEEFFLIKPKRLDFKWFTDEQGLVKLNVPKFNRNIGNSFCKLIKRKNSFIANMDELGSLVWKNCDGKKSVKEILKVIRKEFPNERNIEERLIFFIQQMKNLDYLKY